MRLNYKNYTYAFLYDKFITKLKEKWDFICDFIANVVCCCTLMILPFKLIKHILKLKYLPSKEDKEEIYEGNYIYIFFKTSLLLDLIFFLIKDLMYKYTNNILKYKIIYFFKNWIISILIFFLLTGFLLSCRLIPFNKFLFTLVSLGFFIYILISGFIFFFKKYRFSKYTTAMNRFWRRTFSIFWLLEGFLFLIFLYLVLFSSQDPFFMYDNQQAYKDFTYSWRDFIYESTIVLSIIVILYKFQIRLKDISYSKIFFILSIVTSMLVVLTWLEFYQFYYTVMHYNGIDWLYDDELNSWAIEPEVKKTRIMLHFITICLIAKFWHFVFILAFWIFTVLKWLQSDSIFFSLYGANLQNFIILYLLNSIVMYSWLKNSIRNYTYKGYTWTYTNFRLSKIKLVSIELENFLSSLFTNLYPSLYLIL